MQTSQMTVLGIETSCDDTSVCILRGVPGAAGGRPQVLSHLSFSQETILRKWGGVVPEIAARNHMLKVVPLLEHAFHQAGISSKDLDLVAVTTHPGLLGPLLTGLNAAKTICLLHELPLFPANHLFAHLEAAHLEAVVPYPYLGILVSGGHSMYFRVNSPTDFQMVGSTIDDAAGEAFDKGGKLLGLGYPAGRIIDDLAKKGDPTRFEFPIGLRGSGDAQLSFSGVKTSLRQLLEKNPQLAAKHPTDRERQELWDVCASYQKAIVDALALKAPKAMQLAGLPMDAPVILGGGVACNSALRERMNQVFSNLVIVPPKYCTDNGAMIANYALRNPENAVPFPECLGMDAKNRYVKRGAVNV